MLDNSVSPFFGTSTAILAAKSLTVASIGLFAGVSLAFNGIFVPALRTVPSTTALPVWAASYRAGKKLQVALILTSLAAGSAVYYKTQNPYFLAGPLIMGTIIPYTMAIIGPLNNTLLGILENKSSSADSKTTSDGNVGELINKWDVLHSARTVMSFVALGLTLYGGFFSKTTLVL
ncbi:hypothetical protein EDD11_005803 [Mortierella claussenii]|nr:hypothetical protein EDD11_005803 [Mortierella claussenii]